MMKYALTLLYFLHAISAVSFENKTYAPLNFKSFEDFKNYHQNLIKVIIQKEKETNYPQKLLKQSDEAISFYRQKLFLDYFLSDAFAHHTKKKICFFGGWPTLEIGGNCKTPWSMQNRSEVKKFTPRYDRNHYCGAKNLFRCNPILFGGGEDGKGQCIKLSKYDSTTKLCYEESQDNISELYKKFISDESYRKKYLELHEEIKSFCKRRPDYSACSFLKQSFEDFKIYACKQQEDLEPAITKASSFWFALNPSKWFGDKPPTEDEKEEKTSTQPTTENQTPSPKQGTQLVLTSISSRSVPQTRSPARSDALDQMSKSEQAAKKSLRPELRPKDLAKKQSSTTIPTLRLAKKFRRLRKRPMVKPNIKNVQGIDGKIVRPLKRKCVVSSKYNLSRRLKGSKRSNPHPGIDLAASIGTPVVAIANGRVAKRRGGCKAQSAKSGCNNGFGNQIFIMHQTNGRTWYSSYNHLTKINVSNGEPVTAGVQIGTVGSTGYSTGPHLHIEIMDSNQVRSNPDIYFRGSICGK